LQHVEDRKVRNRRAVGPTLPFHVRDGGAGDAVAELAQQARLADAGLAADSDDLALAANRRLEARLQQIDLAMAAHEGRGAVADSAPHGPAAYERERAALSRRVGKLVELEAALEERRRGLADHDAVGLGAGDQRVE